MHYVVIDRWSRGESILHRRDARAKMLALLAFLIALATTRPFTIEAFSAFAMIALSGVLLSRLPAMGLLARAAVVLPFTLTLAVISALSGDLARAAGLVGKSYISALAVLLLVATTPMPVLLDGASRLGFPRVLILVLQFLYRYLFVITDQAQRMRSAALCRGAALHSNTRQARFQAASGILAVLFASSYEKAEGIQRAMVARGFDGRVHLLTAPRFTAADLTFLITAAVPAALLSFWFSLSA